jgi:CSLREA domain-containing protein
MKTPAISLAAVLCLTVGAGASTFTVNNIFDPGNGICDAVGCTLREAIDAANANPGADSVVFDIPASGINLITLTALLAVIDPVTIDGYTQPGATANTLAVGDNAVLLIELDGESLLEYGLLITASDCVIRGLVINRFANTGIFVEGGSNVIEGNFIGTNAAGTAALGNGFGVGVFYSANNIIGGTTPAARNLISGNSFDGVSIGGDAAIGNQVLGNYIGTDATGTGKLGNIEDGVEISSDASGNLIGDAAAGAGNLISGNARYGVYMTHFGSGSTSGNNIVQGNLIGLDATGTAALGNAEWGVLVENIANNTIGGAIAGAGNVISANGFDGVQISGNTATGNQVQGNLIGTDISGSVDLGNFGDGVLITDAPGNTVGGTTATARNVISGNFNGVQISGDAAGGNAVLGNYIGTNAAGDSDLGNEENGCLIVNAPDCTIGGTVIGAGNVISGGFSGVQIVGATAIGNQVQGNRIGTDAAGTAPLGNGEGVILSNSSNNTTIGGPAGAGNVIAFNLDSGVSVFSSVPLSTGNSIYGNAIFSNGGIAINLDGGTEDVNLVTANDFPDSDTGVNELQNYPTITGISVSGSDRSVEGELASNPSTDYILDFYSNSEADPSGCGEGEIYLGFLDVHTNAQGRVDFTFPLEVGAFGRFITATATDPAGNTSEFSLTSAVVPPISRFLNISTRLRVQTGDNVLIGGFIITGTDPKQVIVRAIGPSLGDFGVQGFLVNPTLELHYFDGTVVTNDDWRDTQEAEIIATGLAPNDDLESAVVATLDPGLYTAIVSGGTGIGLVEAYDLDQTADSILATSAPAAWSKLATTS